MDLEPSEEQRELVALARQVLTDAATAEAWQVIDDDPERHPAAAWAALAAAGLIGVAVSERFGGTGLGLVESALVLEEIGGSALPLPWLHTVLLVAGAVERFGSVAQQAAILPAVVRGELILAAALDEEGCPLPTAVPVTTTAVPVPDGFLLSGRKLHVPHASLAGWLLVLARLPDGSSSAFLVNPTLEGVALTRQEVTTFERRFIVDLNDVWVAEADRLGAAGEGVAIMKFLLDRAWVGLAALQTGVSDQALRLTARHVSEREQFGQKIGTFQAVAQRAADAWIDLQAIRLTSRQAAWRLEQGLDAADEIAIARIWACEAGQRVAHAAQHLHGGLGVVTDYPLHRLFRLAKQLELTLGGAGLQLERLGASIADGPRQGRID